MDAFSEIRIMLALGIGLVAAAWDIKCRKIPNWLTFPGMIAGIVLNEIGNHQNWSFPLTGLLVGLLLLLLPYVMGGIGTGDLKLLMALGAALGAAGVFWTTLYGAVAGGILSFVLMARHYGLSNAFHRLSLLFQTLWNSDCRLALRQQANISKLYIPYGVAIFIGLICFIANGPK